MPLIDISITVERGIPVWPGSPGATYMRALSPEKDGGYITGSRMYIDLHTGTHIDAPRHFVPTGGTIESIPLEKLIGKCLVLDFTGKEKITASALEEANIPEGTQKLLFKTDNSQHWKQPIHTFDTNYCALTKKAAAWIVKKGIHLVGIDYLSIQLFTGSDKTHITLLENEVVILETINLLHVEAGEYELLCLPPKVKYVEGMPVRAVLRTLD